MLEYVQFNPRENSEISDESIHFSQIKDYCNQEIFIL